MPVFQFHARDRSLVDRGCSHCGRQSWSIVREVLVPEASPGAGFPVTLVTLIGASAMAGAKRASELGDLAIRQEFQRSKQT